MIKEYFSYYFIDCLSSYAYELCAMKANNSLH